LVAEFGINNSLQLKLDSIWYLGSLDAKTISLEAELEKTLIKDQGQKPIRCTSKKTGTLFSLMCFFSKFEFP